MPRKEQSLHVSDDGFDLCDVLSSFAWQAKATLHELCKVMGMSGKLIE
jgi:predicted 3'-5' exonuclease similar to PolB exonuclease domain